MNRHHAPGGRLRRIVPTAGSAILVALTVVSCTSDAPASPRTVAVEQGVVSTGVSATGSLSAVSQQYVGFPNGGQLTNVFVKVGDRVEPGQVLAAIDDFALRQKLAQEEGRLNAQQAAVDRMVNSPVADGARDSLAEAKDIVEATRRQNKAVLEADEVAIDNAERQLAVDEDAKEEAEEQLEDSKDACGDDGDADNSDAGNTDGGSTNGGSSGGGNTDGGNTDSGDTGGDDEDSDQDGGDSDDGAQGDDSDSAIGSPISYTTSSARTSQTDPACSAIPSNEAALTAAKQKVAASKGALDSAIQARDVDKANGELAIQNAEQAMVNARNTADSAESDRPFDIAEQKGSLVSMQAAVAAAKRDVENATLRAPVAGTVSAVNGVVGEYLAPSSGTSALAPGSTATIPGVEGTPQGAAAAAAGAANPARPGGTQFLMLDNIDAFQVVAPFNEADAAAIKPNQKVKVAVDALPDLSLTGTVLSLAPTGTAISGVVSYYVTVVVDGKDSRLKDGQTVRATVVTQEVDDVLTVPSAAVRHENGKPTVTVVDAEGTEHSIPFQPGAVGPERTQVVSGLREGQQVVMPVAR